MEDNLRQVKTKWCEGEVPSAPGARMGGRLTPDERPDSDVGKLSIGMDDGGALTCRARFNDIVFGVNEGDSS